MPVEEPNSLYPKDTVKMHPDRSFHRMGPVMEVLNRAAQMIENCKLKKGYG